MIKRILLVRNAYSYDFGGGERYPVYLADELLENGFTPIIASRHRGIIKLSEEHGHITIKGWWWSFQNFSGTRIFLTPVYLIWVFLLTLWYSQLIIRLRIDVLHLQSRDDFIAGSIAGKLLRKTVVWTDHADLKYIFQNTNKPFKNPIGKILATVAKLADSIIIVSKNELKLISQRLKRPESYPFIVIYNGIKDVAIASKRNEPKNTSVFVSTSRLVYSKGISELIEATTRLIEDGFKIKTILLGDGPNRESLLKTAPKEVVFMGFPPNALNILKGADFFVHPSYNEAFSLSIVEAAMLAMPSIVTDVGGNPEIVVHEKTGLLVRPKDSEDLYLAMKFAINNKTQMTKYGQKLRVEYEKDFQFDLIVKKQIISLYNETA